MAGNKPIRSDEIQSRIYTLRGLQVMIDSDLANLYGVEVKRLNEQVKRNIERFPEEFSFQLTAEEIGHLKSQIATSSWGGRRKAPYAFTEEGVAMLSAVLHSETAIKTSIKIMNAFVVMRHFILSNAEVFQRLDILELKQLATDKKIDEVLTAIESKKIQPNQGIFFNGQIFDAYKFVSDLIRSADSSIILIDNYVDDTVFTLFSKRKKGVTLTILTKAITKQIELDVIKFHEQYPAIEIKEFKNSHDRFLIIDNKTVFHFGASLKDLGKKWFAFSKMEMGVFEMLKKLDGII